MGGRSFESIGKAIPCQRMRIGHGGHCPSKYGRIQAGFWIQAVGRSFVGGYRPKAYFGLGLRVFEMKNTRNPPGNLTFRSPTSAAQKKG